MHVTCRAGSIALLCGGIAFFWAAPALAQELPPLPPPSAAETEVQQLEQESARLSQEARELGGGRTIGESASNVRNSFYEHKAIADELEQFAEDMGYTEEELRAEQRRIAESGRITFLDVWKGGWSQIIDHYRDEAIERFISATLAKVIGLVTTPKDCYDGMKALKLWWLTRQQAGSLGDSADSIRRNWVLLNELLIVKYLEMAREAAKMRRLDEIQQRYREIRDRIATLQQRTAEAAKPATDHAATGRDMDSGYDLELAKLEFQRKIASLEGRTDDVRRLDREIETLERQAQRGSTPRQASLNQPSNPLLDYHNALRAVENSPPLKWSDALKADAAKWAQVLATTGELKHAPRDSRPANQRENISLSPRGTKSALQLAQRWGDEKKHFKSGVFPNVCAGDWSACAHFTQMVWSTTTEVGCAFAQGTKYDALVCRYSPPGNQDNKPVIVPGLQTTARDRCPPLPQATSLRTTVN